LVVNYNRKPYIFKDSTLTKLDIVEPGFYLTNIYAVNSSLYYFGGGYPGQNRRPEFIIWDKGSTYTFTIPDNRSTITFDFEVIEPGNVWVGNNLSNKAYHFLNGNFKEYFMPDTNYYTQIYKSPDNTIYAYGYTFGSVPFIYMYRLNNDSFELVLKDTLYKEENYTHLIHKCGTDLVMKTGSEMNILLRFDGVKWIQFGVGNYNIGNLGGLSYRELISFNWDQKIYIMNSEFKWRAEENFKLPYSVYREMTKSIYFKYDRVYFPVMYEDYPNHIVIGKKNKFKI
jgi:hypothetical protein